ncbi:MAG: sigma-70 family RNA polymerase sigma factor [Phaeodactylibacter sp.]|nr:sigma-70 family RNA polymerase sigma factor [Phaeodactylibacter sp.]
MRGNSQEIETAQALVDGLKKGDRTAFEEVYRQYFKMAASFVQNNRGTAEDARDIFQEMLFILVKKLRDPEFVLSSKLGTYMYSIIRHLWLKRLNKQQKLQVTDEEGLEPVPVTDEEIDLKQSYERKHELMAKVLQRLKEDCKKIILSSFYEKRKHAEIADYMGISPAFVRVKLHRCMEQFRKDVRNHPDFKTLDEA